MPAADGSERRLVILEPDIEGHPREWLQHLMRFAASIDERYVVWLVVAPEVYRELNGALSAARDGQLRLLALRPLESRLCRHPPLLLRPFPPCCTIPPYL